jgi:hypothetical protein
MILHDSVDATAAAFTFTRMIRFLALDSDNAAFNAQFAKEIALRSLIALSITISSKDGPPK